MHAQFYPSVMLVCMCVCVCVSLSLTLSPLYGRIQAACSCVRVVLQEEDVVLNKRAGAVLRLMYRQRFFQENIERLVKVGERQGTADVCVCVCVCARACACACVCACMLVRRGWEVETERERHTHTHTHTHICLPVCCC